MAAHVDRVRRRNAPDLEHANMMTRLECRRDLQPVPRCTLLGAIILTAAHTTFGQAVTADDTVMTLDNGMRIIVAEAARFEDDVDREQSDGIVAMVAHFAVGDAHDPPGASGMSHLVEHLFVTAAAGDAPPRTAMDLMRAYPQGHTAQTSFDYTIIGAMFDAGRLESEITDLASRINDLRITEADLAREKPRMRIELTNMYGGMPQLAAINHARMRLGLLPDGLRRGGIEAEIDAITLDDATNWYGRHYHASNLVIAIVGAVDVDHLRPLIHQYFAPLPAGEPTRHVVSRTEQRAADGNEAGDADGAGESGSAPGTAGAAGATGTAGAIDTTTTESTITMITVDARPGSDETPIATLAFAVPQPGDDRYAAYLAALGAVMLELQTSGRMRGHPYPMPIFVAPHDDPTTLALNRAVEPDADARDVIEAMRTWLTTTTTFDDASLTRVKQFAEFQIGWIAGITDPPPHLRHMNPYPVALAAVRHLHTGVDRDALRSDWRDLTAEEATRTARLIFSPGNSAAVVIQPE